MRTILLLKLSLMVVFSSSAQEYFPFPTVDAQWNVLIVSTCNNNSPPDTVFTRYSINGDTTINEIAYKKLYRETGSAEESTIEGVGGLREKDKKIYFTGKGFTGIETDGEILLYDFTKQIGETINHDSKGTFYSKILEVDSIKIGDHFRKRYKVDNGWISQNPDYIIEGIGSVNNGLLGHISDIPTCGTHFWEHICFIDQTIELVNPNFISCNSKKRKVYIPEFAPIGAKWYYGNRESPLGSPAQGYLEIESIGDTVIEGKISQILKRTYFSSIGEINEAGYNYVYSENNKVYYYDQDRFNLLYDFTLEVGDTLIVKEPYFTNTTADSTFMQVVDSIKMLNVDGKELKVLYFNTNRQWDLFWIHIEKIGNIPYMFPQAGLDCDASCLDPFRCYIDDEISYTHPWWGYSCDELISSIENKNLNLFKVFPNPANNVLFIEFDDRFEDPRSIKIYDSSGRCVKSVIEKSVVDKTSIDVSSLPSGLYYIEVNNSWRDKLIIL